MRTAASTENGTVAISLGEMTPLSLRSNFSWIATGNAVAALSQWGMIIVLAHLGGPAMIGQVVLAFAVCAPVAALSQLGLRTAVVTDAKGEFRFGDYLALRLITSIGSLVIVSGIAVVVGFRLETALIIIVVSVGETFSSVSDIFYAILQRHERMDRIAISRMIRAPLMLVLLAAGVLGTGNVVWAVVGLPVAAAVALFAYDLPGGASVLRASGVGRLRPCWNTSTLLRLAWISLPLGVILAMAALATAVPRYYVGHYLGESALGIFASIVYLAVVGAKVVTAIGQSAAPRMAKHYAAGDMAAYLRLLGKLTAVVGGVGAVAVLVVAVAGRPLLAVIYGSEFGAYAELAVYLTVAGAVGYLGAPLSVALEATRRFKTHMVIRCAAILVLVGLLPWLTVQHGLKGAAVAMLAGSACSTLACAGAVAYYSRGNCRQERGGKPRGSL
ncbi:MAG: oligosaccharide flippase family protein [Candidatus Nealsonbacteria bacterium]|nr:oligosaccharide flippase family protein [Candidatus Nealsonbacteria bacterium]